MQGGGKAFPAQDEDDPQAQRGEEEAVEEDAVRGQAAAQQGQAEQGDETESGGGNEGEHETHDSSPRRWIDRCSNDWRFPTLPQKKREYKEALGLAVAKKKGRSGRPEKGGAAAC